MQFFVAFFPSDLYYDAHFLFFSGHTIKALLHKTVLNIFFPLEYVGELLIIALRRRVKNLQEPPNTPSPQTYQHTYQ